MIRGELVESVDFEKLKAELGTFTDLFEARRERYGLDWPGKKEALKLIQTPTYATLKPCREESVNFDTTENLFIEGDNLEVLKLLQKSYYGKVKMIYIDPPYNTGKEFIYPDNYSESLNTYLEYAGLIDGDGKKFSTNTANEGRFHTKWLNMMLPRLYLARNLLRDDGVIFISIDDNEVDNLKKLCNEIFGEENGLFAICRETIRGGSKSENIRKVHDYCFCYVKNYQEANFSGFEKEEIILDKEDDKGKYRIGRELNKWGAGSRREDSPGMWFPIKGPNGEDVFPIRNDGTEGRWRLGKEKMHKRVADGDVIFEKREDGTYIVYEKIRETKPGVKQLTTLFIENYTNSKGTETIKKVFNIEKSYFDYVKPIELINDLMILCDCQESDIILDFFAGSATTAQAVLDFKIDNNCQFILIQLPEPCDGNSEAYKAGYKTIADIGKERIRRVINKLNQEYEGKLGLDNSTKQDRGFKVLKLDKSNFKQWQKLEPDTKPEEILEQLELHIDHISKASTSEELLYEILLKAGFTPTEKIEEKTIAGIKVYSVAEGALLLCLENTVTKELIDAVADLEPMQFICLDSAFQGNDQLKANAVQTFAARNMQKEKHNQIVFKTV